MIVLADARRIPLVDGCVQCCVTSPPYWGLRDYGMPGQIGLEASPEIYVAAMVDVFRQVRRVLQDDGVLWLNLGDSYATGGGRVGEAPGGGKQGEAWRSRGVMTTPNRMPIDGLKPKDLVGVPWRVAFALQADGWYLRSEVIWSKPNPMPESVTDRPTKAHETVFLLTKSERYFYDADAIADAAVTAGGRAGYAGYSLRAAAMGREPTGNEKPGMVAVNADTRNARSVWNIPTKPYAGAHFATMPERLAERCIMAGSRPGDLVLDPFGGSGTTVRVARSLNRRGVMLDLNPAYLELARARTAGVQVSLLESQEQSA